MHLGGTVNHAIGLGDRRADGQRIANIAVTKFDGQSIQRCVVGMFADKHVHILAMCNEQPHNIVSDQASRAGN